MHWLRRFAIGCAILLIGAIVLHVTHWSTPALNLIRGKKTIDQRLAEHAPSARARLRAAFEAANLPYPPNRVTLLAIKDQKRLEVYAPDEAADMRFITSYPIRAASGGPGPKLRRGDRQVPEGVYRIESLNPNSRFHLALRLNYPNDFDRAMAARDGRTNLGGDIMIHGKDASVGCLAMGDEPAEDLFVLAADCGIENVRVIIVPTDLRAFDVSNATRIDGPPWVGELYEELRQEVTALSSE